MTSNEKKLHKIIHSVGLNNNLRDIEVYNILYSQFKFIHETILGMSFNNLTKEEIENLRTSFILKYIGKIYTDQDTIQKIHNRKSFLKKLKEEHESRERDEGRTL